MNWGDAMQNKIKMNNIVIKQPDKDGWSPYWETSHTEDSDRSMTGQGHFTPLFTVEAFSYKASDLTIQEMKQILQIIARGKPFDLFYHSPYYGTWRAAKFYVSGGNISCGCLKVDEELYESLSFNAIGVNPI